MTKRTLTLAGLLVLAFVVIVSSIHFITPEEATVTAIGETFYRIHLFAKTNGALPDKLVELPKRDNYANRVTDGWGRDLLFEIDEDGVMTLRSLGKDGKVGGSGPNRDMVRSYRTRDQDDRFIVADDMWIVDGELR